MGFKVDKSYQRYTDPNVQIRGHVRFEKPIALSKGKKLVALVESRNNSVFAAIKDVLHTLGLIKYNIGYIVQDDAGKETYFTDLTKEDYEALNVSMGDGSNRKMPILEDGIKKAAEFLHNRKKEDPKASALHSSYRKGEDPSTKNLDELNKSLDLCEKAGALSMGQFRRELESLYAKLSQQEINSLAKLLHKIAKETNVGKKTIEVGKDGEAKDIDESIWADYRLNSHSYLIHIGHNELPLNLYFNKVK